MCIRDSTFTLHVFMTPGQIIWELGFLKITIEGIRQAVFMTVRLIYLVTITSLLTLTTTPISLTDGIESVSYTHLDVYKRQDMSGNITILIFLMNCFLTNLPRNGRQMVS